MTRRRIIWLWIALTALVFSSCGKNEPQAGDDAWEPLTGDTPISFTTKIGAETKTGSLSTISTNFHVFAFYQPGVVDDDPLVDYTGTWDDLSTQHWTPNFMYDQPVTWNNNGTPADDSDDYWNYAPIKYWPNNAENTITFWAYSPYYGEYEHQDFLRLYKSNSVDAYGNNVPGVPEIEFTTDGTRDFLVSDLAKDLSYRGGNPADGTVSLVFHHTMSWIDFRVKKVDDSDNYDIVLKSIRLENLCQTAVYKLDGWGSGWSRVNFSAYDCGVGAGTALDKDEEDRITFPTNGTKLLLIPQALRYTAANLEVVYTFHVKGSGGDPVEYEENVRLGKLTTLWEEGKHYTYNVNISPGNPIQFTAVAAAWDSEQNGYFNVN